MDVKDALQIKGALLLRRFDGNCDFAFARTIIDREYARSTAVGHCRRRCFFLLLRGDFPIDEKEKIGVGKGGDFGSEEDVKRSGFDRKSHKKV